MGITQLKQKIVSLITLVLILNCSVVFAKKMYRLVDENGNVYYADHVLADQVEYKRETLTEKARVVDVLDKAKKPEQIKLQKKLDILKQEQEKIVAKQASNDKVLLTSYHSVEEIRTAMVNKLGVLDVQQKALASNLQRLEQQLALNHQKAAEFERDNKKVPDQLVSEIANTKQTIEITEQELNQHLASRKKAEQDFKADMGRYQFLTSSAKSDNKNQEENNAVSSLGLYVCQEASQCELAWKFAGEFVGRYSTTAKDVENDSLIMRAAPVKDNDISLSVSKLGQGSGQMQIFLDVRCRNNSLGKELCSGGQVQSIRESFTPYIQSMLAPH